MKKKKKESLRRQMRFITNSYVFVIVSLPTILPTDRKVVLWSALDFSLFYTHKNLQSDLTNEV